MPQGKDECKLSIILRLSNDVLDFFSTEGKSWKGSYYNLYFLGWIFRDPLTLDAIVEEGSEETVFFGRRDSTKITLPSKFLHHLSLKLGNLT